jgi:hypothetical protein
MKEKMRFLATSLKRERERREQSFQGYSEKLCEILKTKKAYRLLNTYSKRQSQIWWYRTDKHRKKEKTEDDEQQQETSEKTNPNMRQRNTGKAQHTASRRKFCESGKNMKSLCVQICDVEHDLSRNLVLSFRHERSGEEESLARENYTLRQTSHEDDRLLSLSRQASVFLLHCHFIFPKPTFQMCPRLAFLRLKFTPRWEKRPQRRASFELGPKGVLFLFFMDGWDSDLTTWSCGSMRRLLETVTSRGEGVVENRSI